MINYYKFQFNSNNYTSNFSPVRRFTQDATKDENRIGQMAEGFNEEICPGSEN